MSDQTEYDLVVVGGGSGGVACARRAASYGAKVALVEGSRLGGTCVIRGCVPKKLLMYASQFGAQLRDGLQPGWVVHEASFSMQAWQQAKQTEIDRLEGIYAKMLQNSGVEVFRGWASLPDANHVQVGQTVLATRRILIATGGAPNRTAFEGLDIAPTSNELLDLTELPAHIGIVGAGYIAMEFACIMRGLGARVSVYYRAELPLRGFDLSLRQRAAEAMQAQGIELHPHSDCKKLERVADQFVLHTQTGAHRFDWILNATGRSPNTEGLGLDRLGVRLGAAGEVLVDEWNRSSVQGIFAVGDVTNRVNLTPVAIAQGRALAENEFNGKNLTVDHNSIPSAAFTSPPIATVGLTEEQAAASGPVRVFETAFRPMKTAFSGGNQQTYMKLVIDDRTDRILGIHMLGDDAPEMIQVLGITYVMGATKADFDRTVAVHPTSAEEWVLMREISRRV
ncbi:glutathione-disulfide reductase [Limnobacter sp.]|uniref:glutathione-disulfide reductase n=1 Tax=Limnobacter sp. TaxID=2003368 RepID=UPI0025835EAE|nr:glutathione-disulfide reductase [Limnobacter sp.]